MKFNSLIPELTVQSIEATKKFYMDVLHFRMEYERPEDRFIFLSLEGNQMMFQEDNDNWGTGPLEYPYGRGINFEMTVTDVDALYQDVIRAGIPPFVPMKVSHYRSGEEDIVQKEFLIQDPDGYLLRFTN